MSEFGLPEYSALAQILLTIITFIGIVASMWLSRKALREVQTDRKLRQRPFLGFETGGYQLPIEFVKAGKAIPGINPEYVQKAFPNLPNDAESVRLKDIRNENGSAEILFYGQLKNYGLGPALSTKITWIPKEIWIGSERFVVDEKKLSEPLYSEALNSMPSIPTHILPGEQAKLSRLPTFVEKDFEKKITRVEGVFEIKSKDVFGERHITIQRFHLFADYKCEKPYVHVTFSDFVGTDIT
jgi:hypothetical protein